GYPQAADLVAEVEIPGHRLAYLVEQAGEVFWSRRHSAVDLVDRRVLQGLGRCCARLALLGEHLRRDRVTPDVGRDHDEPVYELRILDRCEERHAATQRVAEQVGLLEV